MTRLTHGEGDQCFRPVQLSLLVQEACGVKLVGIGPEVGVKVDAVQVGDDHRVTWDVVTQQGNVLQGAVRDTCHTGGSHCTYCMRIRLIFLNGYSFLI